LTILLQVTQAIARLMPQYIRFPQTAEEKSRIQQGFYEIARFPRVLGALDCTHVKVKSPGKSLRLASKKTGTVRKSSVRFY
jgi:hypothetical protein